LLIEDTSDDLYWIHKLQETLLFDSQVVTLYVHTGCSSLYVTCEEKTALTVSLTLCNTCDNSSLVCLRCNFHCERMTWWHGGC